MKKLLSVVLSLCMLLSVLPLQVCAASAVSVFNITVTEPMPGEKPDFKGTMPITASAKVIEVAWEGQLDGEGKFKPGTDYRVYVTARIKDGMDKYVRFVANTATINGKPAGLDSVSDDQLQIILTYTFTTLGSAQADDPNTAAYVELTKTDFEWEVLRLCNIERAKEGLTAFSMIETLQRACDIRKKEIATVFSHTRPDGSDFLTAIPANFNWKMTGENIAIGQSNPKTVVQSWMDSPEHRANILNPDFEYMGIGYNADGNRWVQLFADRKVIARATPSIQTTAVSPEIMLNHYLTLKTEDGYISYIPLDFTSMKFQNGHYSPRIVVPSIPEFEMVPDSENGETEEDKEADADKVWQDRHDIQKALDELTDERQFTKNGLLNVARGAASQGSTVTWTDDFAVFAATETEEGFIEGTLKISINSASLTATVYKTLSRKPFMDHENTLFDCFIPIEYVYGAALSVSGTESAGDSLQFNVGTQFVDETSLLPHMFGVPVKRKTYQGGYIKINYLGTYGSIDEELAVQQLNLASLEEYKQIVKGEGLGYENFYNLTGDTVVISVDVYGSDKQFVRTLSPACVVYAIGTDGSFITLTKNNNTHSSIYFSTLNNLFNADEDAPRNTRSMVMNTKAMMVADKSAIDTLFPGIGQVIPTYEFIQHPVTEGEPNYNANKILSEEEFITPDNTYYYVACEPDAIDPVIRQKIDNVISYSQYRHNISPGYTQRNVVSADGTLYGITSENELTAIDRHVQKTCANHYMTKDGIVKELNGKVVASDCLDFEESYDGRMIGILKKDGSFHLGYTYVAGGDGYSEGLSQKLEKAICIVSGGVCDAKGNFYRWNESILSIDLLTKTQQTQLDVVKICSDAVRIFPHEEVTKAGATDQQANEERITGFVQTQSGELIGFGTDYSQSFGEYGMVEKMFPLSKNRAAGSFVGFKVEDENIVHAIVCRVCDNNQYKSGILYDPAKRVYPEFVSETSEGFLGADHCVYSVAAQPFTVEDHIVQAEVNATESFGQIDASTRTFRAFNSTTNEAMTLLPNISGWYFGENRICLLEREDGSMWMSAIIPETANADLIATLGGYENSNVIQITEPTKQKPAPEYVEPAVETVVRFTDVASDAWYAAAVDWAVEKAITTGTTATTFSPDDTCTRAQILTFLWRAVDSPQSDIINPFTDVDINDYYYGAALWAYDKGLVQGGFFNGDAPCTRSSAVVFLWQNAGVPETSNITAFVDVPAFSAYSQAVTWAVHNGITMGTSETTFSPDSICTRGQIVTLLQRALQ